MKLLAEFDCVVTVIKGKLYLCKLDKDRFISMSAGMINWEEVHAPLRPGFLEAANARLGTHFKAEDFTVRERLNLAI